MSNENQLLPAFYLSREAAKSNVLQHNPVIVPRKDSWDDFGYQLMADIGFQTDGGRVEWLAAKFAVHNEMKLWDFVQRTLVDGRAFLPLSEVGQPYASLLVEDKSYAVLRRSSGAEGARRLLNSVNDVSLLARSREAVPGWPDFFQSEAFALSMVRSSESYQAYQTGADILDGKTTSGEEARVPFRARLAGRTQPRVDLHFAFESANTLRGRISVLIGVNGCGKTSSLARLAIGLSDLRSASAHFEPRPVVNQVLAFAHPSSLRLFSSRNTRGSARIRLFSLDPVGTSKWLRGDLKLLADLARSYYGGTPALNYVVDVFEKEFPDLRLYVPVKSGGAAITGLKGGWVPAKELAGGSERAQLQAVAEIDLSRHLEYLDQRLRRRAPSLGQLMFMRFAMNAIAYASPASVFVVDEPENFLHPNLISRFMRLLNQVLEWTNSIAIVATHSPYVVREVQSAQVQVFTWGAEGLSIRNPRLQTLGSNVDAISLHVFGDDTPTHLYEELLGRAEILQLPFSEVLARFAREMSVEALMLVRRLQESGRAEA